MNNIVTQKQENADTKYIVIEDKMFVYQMTRYNKAANTAHLTLYKNPDDLLAEKPFKQIEVGAWL